MADLPHLTAAGTAHMVDVGEKEKTHRVAIAEGYLEMSPAALAALVAGNLKKGDALAAARIAGIMAAKRTWELVPLCHPVALTHLEVEVESVAERVAVRCRARAETRERTGVEMEALTAVQVALLTVYDMCKAIDKGMRITDVGLVHKSGGRSGTWQRQG
ncbi:cyclic pyranopterin monophosphate synthase MoaC [Tepidiphilus baoligensis]|uniref:Cyclic pyranopterin monophosphate synthase n=1 Tax=Tepidiphilus baoligensis TaxID=2698687 RepID=A0ABX1QMT8_9PROT|nr:cyclic pyranopterin monophosphate synthase MoaC [Tepidiphilus baoligensis]NMH16539.1 cyclic pyranopterin monophosphate synthase MoaC [Tepidiphilus baoligensis]